jgi:hypothetical protein
MAHVLAEHTCPLGQGVPHAPQFDGSLTVLTQAPLQLVVPPTHCSPQCPAEQTLPPVQAVPHIPQLAGSVAGVTHALTHFVVPPAHNRPH